MYRYGKIIGILTGIFLMLSIFGYMAIDRQQDAILVSVDNVQGNPALVENLVYTAETGGGNAFEVRWDTKIPLAHPELTTTTCLPETTDRMYRTLSAFAPYFTVELNPPISFSLEELDIYREQLTKEYPRLLPLVEDFYSRTAPGELAEETVSLSDCGIRPKIDVCYSLEAEEDNYLWEATTETSFLKLPLDELEATITIDRTKSNRPKDMGYWKIAEPCPKFYTAVHETMAYILTCNADGSNGVLYHFQYGRGETSHLLQKVKLTTLPEDWISTGLALEGSHLTAIGPAGMLTYDLEAEDFTETPLPTDTWSPIPFDDALLLQTETGDFRLFTWQGDGYHQTIQGVWDVTQEPLAYSYGYAQGILLRQTIGNHMTFTLQCYGPDGQWYAGDYALHQGQEQVEKPMETRIGWRLYLRFGVIDYLQVH